MHWSKLPVKNFVVYDECKRRHIENVNDLGQGIDQLDLNITISFLRVH